MTGKDETRPRFTGGFEDCRFPIGNDTSHTFALPDGRKLGYAEYGSPTGRVVFFLHGTPSSRIEAASFHHIAVRLGARIISVDRPGYGWSEIQKERKVADYAGDIEALAEGLRVEEYAVLVCAAPELFMFVISSTDTKVNRVYQAEDPTRSLALLACP